MNRTVPITIPLNVVLLLVSESILITGCYLLAAYWVISELEIYLLYDSGLLQIVINTAMIQLGLYFQLMYDAYTSRSRLVLIQQLCVVLGCAFLLQSAYAVMSPTLTMPQWIMIYGSLLTAVTVPAWRIIFAAIANSVPTRQVLFLGNSVSMPPIVRHLREHPEQGWAAAGFMDAGNGSVDSLPHLGSLQDLDAILPNLAPQQIITGFQNSTHPLPTRQLLDLQLSGTVVEDASDFHETTLGRMSSVDLHPEKLVFSNLNTSNALHDLLSILAGLVALILTGPLLLLLSVFLKLFSSGPVLERTNCVGLLGEPFSLLSFHSDPGTAVGRWLRRSGLYKLPNVFNLLRGELAVIGPAPDRQEFAAALQREIPFYIYRHTIKPGVTGWCQILTGNELRSALEKIEYDLYYVRHPSAAFDAYILLHTVFPLSRPGAKSVPSRSLD